MKKRTEKFQKKLNLKKIHIANMNIVNALKGGASTHPACLTESCGTCLTNCEETNNNEETCNNC